MATPRRPYTGSAGRMAWAGLIVVGAVLASSPGQVADPRRTPTTAQDTRVFSSPADAEKALAALEETLQKCTDGDAAAGIRYRMAVLCFQLGRMEDARGRFVQLADTPACPASIRRNCLNMIGQICRLTGSNQEALEAFAKLASLVERGLTGETATVSQAEAAKLLCLARFSRAEIYESGGQWEAGLAECRHLSAFLKSRFGATLSPRYGPLAADRLCQFLLRTGALEEYFDAARTLVRDHPSYPRTGLVELEMECLRFLRSVQEKVDCADGSLEVPARAVAALREAEDKSVARDLLRTTGQLCEKYQQGYGALVLAYQYAWLLDAAGSRSEEALVLDRILSAAAGKTWEDPRERHMVNVLGRYAGLQRAVISIEQGNCLQVLNVLSGWDANSCTPHMLELRNSLIQCAKLHLKEDRPYGRQ